MCQLKFEPYVPVVVAKYAGAAAGSSWLGSALLPATLAYSTVKGKSKLAFYHVNSCAQSDVLVW